MVAASRFPGCGLAEPHLAWELVLLPILILSELGGHWCDGVQSTGPQAGPPASLRGDRPLDAAGRGFFVLFCPLRACLHLPPVSPGVPPIIGSPR